MNKKVINATKCVIDGIEFDSKLEGHAYAQFKYHHIRFRLKPKFVIQEKFRFHGKGIQQITLTPDFYLIDLNIVVDTKGFSTDSATLKFKLFKRYLFDEYTDPPNVIILKTKKDVDLFIAQNLSIASPTE